MKYQSNPTEIPREEPAPEMPERTLEDLMASFSMKPRVAIPRDMHKGLLILVVSLTLSLVLGTAVLLAGGAAFWSRKPPNPRPNDKETEAGIVKPEGDDPTATYPYADGRAGNALLSLPDSVATVDASLITSQNALVADVASGTVLASLRGDEPMYPASLTKVMTLIVLVERLPHEASLQDVVTVSREVADKMVAEGASGFGFKAGMQLTVESLMYALMLQSDGIAACELARYVAGSETVFVGWMNEKAAAMGLTVTHFENPTGLHHPDHKSTAREMASIMAYAMNMNLCRRVLTSEVFRTTITDEAGEQDTYAFYNNLLVHHFERVNPHHPSGMTVLAGKTGYTPESGTCLVTYAESSDGRGYVCVTANTQNYASCIGDYIALYNTHAQP